MRYFVRDHSAEHDRILDTLEDAQKYVKELHPNEKMRLKGNFFEVKITNRWIPAAFLKEINDVVPESELWNIYDCDNARLISERTRKDAIASLLKQKGYYKIRTEKMPEHINGLYYISAQTRPYGRYKLIGCLKRRDLKAEVIMYTNGCSVRKFN